MRCQLLPVGLVQLAILVVLAAASCEPPERVADRGPSTGATTDPSPPTTTAPTTASGDAPPRSEPPPPPPTQAKRLLHFQTVGHSHTTNPGRISPNVCTPEAGWQVHVDRVLRPLVERLGPGAFDWWGHNPGGAWPDTYMDLAKNAFSSMRFRQLEIARERFPQLVNYKPLADFARQNDIELYGYIGFPLCDSTSRFIFEPDPDQCDPEHFDRWYGEFVEYGFKGVGHDWSAALPKDSAVLRNNFPMLRARGIEPFIEPVPFRYSPQLLGWSVVAEMWSWEKAASDPLRRYSEREIIEAGGRAIHLVLRPRPGTEVPDQTRWQFETAKRLLAEGHTVAVPLNPLVCAGYPIEELVELSRMPTTGGLSD